MEFSPEWFDHDALRAADRVLGATGTGRSRALLLHIEPLALVLRRFRRGGLISRFVTDSYLFIGLERTRAFREFNLLAQMKQVGLPVPAPVAAEVRRSGTRYRASLLMERLPGCTLGSMLGDSMSLATWQRVGACIRQFHDGGFWHADLNVHNILVTADADGHAGTCHLIDFDRARKRNPHDNRWRQRNLQRLQRSVYKVWPEHDIARVPGLAAEGWQALLDGYASPAREDGSQ